MRSWKEKRILGENKGHWIKMNTIVFNNSVSILLH